MITWAGVTGDELSMLRHILPTITAILSRDVERFSVSQDTGSAHRKIICWVMTSLMTPPNKKVLTRLTKQHCAGW